MSAPSGAGNFQFVGTSPYSAGLIDGFADYFDNPVNRLRIGGVENEIQFNGFTINVKGKQDSIKITSIDGLSDADVRDSRDVNPGYDGETAFESLYGGRTIAISGFIRAGTLNKLRDMQEGLKSIFAPLDEAALIFKGVSPEYDLQIFCRKTQPITMGETQQGFDFKRDFQVTLRASDFRFTSKQIEETYWDSWENNKSYKELVLADEPSVYWRMDEPSGASTFINSVASGTYAGTIVGTPVGANASGAVLDGSYWDFNGTTDYVTSSFPAFPSGADRSFEAWVYRDTSDTEDVIFGSDDASTSPRISFPSGTNSLFFDPDGANGGAVTITSSGIGSVGSWKHLVLTFYDPADTVNVYLNGSLVASGTTAEHFNASAGNLRVGASAKSPASHFNGKIAEVAVYPEILTAAKVFNHYNARTRYFTGEKYATQIVNQGNYLADSIIKIEGPITASSAGGIGITISNTADENLNLISASSAQDYLAQDLSAISSGNQTTALAITHYNKLIITAPSGSTQVLGENEYFLINANSRTIRKYSSLAPDSAYSQLDINSEWIKFSPGINPIYVECTGSSRPLITFYYRHSFI